MIESPSFAPTEKESNKPNPLIVLYEKLQKWDTEHHIPPEDIMRFVQQFRKVYTEEQLARQATSERIAMVARKHGEGNLYLDLVALGKKLDDEDPNVVDMQNRLEWAKVIPEGLEDHPSPPILTGWEYRSETSEAFETYLQSLIHDEESNEEIGEVSLNTTPQEIFSALAQVQEIKSRER